MNNLTHLYVVVILNKTPLRNSLLYCWKIIFVDCNITEKKQLSWNFGQNSGVTKEQPVIKLSTILISSVASRAIFLKMKC